MNKEEKGRFDSIFKDSAYRTVSEMLRDVILDRKYKVQQSSGDTLIQLGRLKTELNRVGVNLNSLTKAFISRGQKYIDQKEKEQLLMSLRVLKEDLDVINSKIEESIYKHDSQDRQACHPGEHDLL